MHVRDEHGWAVEVLGDGLGVLVADAGGWVGIDVRALGADHPSMPLLLTVPGVGWVLAYTIASEVGDIGRFSSPKKT